jgi:2'-5' RNA ligase
MIFPKFHNIEVIDKIREQFDPLSNHVRPHITLVFPFESSISTSNLKEHISTALSDVAPFNIELNKVIPNNNFGRYLFLNVQKGNHAIIELHKKLYTGIVQEYYPKWLKETRFLPHMTVGSFDNDEEFHAAIEATQDINDTFKTTVNEISVEIIDENEDSIIEMTISLKALRG